MANMRARVYLPAPVGPARMREWGRRPAAMAVRRCSTEAVLPRKSLNVAGRPSWLLTSSNFLSWVARVDALGGLQPFQPAFDDTSFTGKIRRSAGGVGDAQRLERSPSAEMAFDVLRGYDIRDIKRFL
jgi:hypothetical protein